MRSDELLIAKTESAFRSVNERIVESATSVGASEAEFVCECDDPGCGRRITAPIDDYERVRSNGARFLVAPEHEEQGHEEVLASRPGYRIIEKLRAVGAAARRLSPRPAR